MKSNVKLTLRTLFAMLALIVANQSAVAQLTNSVYGFYYAVYPGAGSFATNVNGFANIAHLQWTSPADADSIIACNSKLMLDTTWVFWDGTNSLRSNYQAVWNSYKAQLTPYYISQIAAFYVMDEPYLHGLTPAQLQTAVACIKTDFPNIPVAVTFAYTAFPSFTNSSWIPANLDWISFDQYGDFNAIPGLLATIKTYKQPNQKVFLTSQGYRRNGADSDATVADWSYDYHDLYLSEPEIMGQLVFLCRGAREYVFPSDGTMPLTYAVQQTIGTEVLKMGNSFKRAFSDMFESGPVWTANWAGNGAWARATTRKRPGGSYSAHVVGPVTDSALTSGAVGVSGAKKASVNFWWYISGLDSGEYVRCDVKLDDGAWVQKASIDGGGALGSKWLHVIVSDIDVSSATNLHLRFRGKMDLASENASVDSVNVCKWADPANLIANGDFTANAAAFVGNNGLLGDPNPATITSWTAGTGAIGLNGPATTAGTAYGPLTPGSYTFAFMNWGDVNGSTHLRQTLSGGYTPKTQYKLSFDAAGFRWGPATAFRVRIIDNSTTHVSTGSLDSAPLTSFTHFSYVFTSPLAFDGPPVIRFENLTTGNVGVDFANVSLVWLATKTTSTTSLSPSVNPSTYGGAVTLTAIVITTNGIPTGTVTFKDGLTMLGAVVLPSGFGNSATAALMLTNLPVATHSLTASYGGDANFAASVSSPVSQVVNPRPLIVTGVTAGNKVYDGGTNAALNGTAALAGVVSGDTVTLGGTPVASFGNKNVGNAKPVSVSGYTLGGASATNYSLTQPNLSANITARPVALSGSRVYDGTSAAAAAILTIGNNLDGANLTLSGSGTLASRNAGAQAISAGTLALGGSAASNYTLTGLSGAVTITASSSTTALAGSLNPSPTGTNVTFTATVTAMPPGTGTPTNTVQFRTNGVATALVNLNGGAQAAFATSLLPHGSNVVTAEYVSDGNFLASTSSVVQVVNMAPVANPLTLGAVSGLPATLPITGGTNVTDADGDPMTVTAVSAPAHGIASTEGTNVTYTATNSFAGTDSFNYTVSDSYGGTATNTVTVSVIANSADLNRMTVGLSGGNVVLTFLGVPGNRYALEQTLSLSPAVWLPVMTNPAAANGYLLFTNSPQPDTNSFWRTRHVP